MKKENLINVLSLSLVLFSFCHNNTGTNSGTIPSLMNEGEKYESKDSGFNLSTPQILKVKSNQIRKDIKFSDVIKDLKFIPLETTADCLIGQIDKIILHNNRFYILDCSKSKALFVFNLDGKFVRKMSKLGRGPGEYNRPEDFCFEPKTDNIVILNNNKLNYYQEDGTFIRATNLAFFASKFAFPDENHIAFWSRGTGYNLTITNAEGKVENSYFKYVKETTFGLHIPFVEGGVPGLIYLASFDYTIYKINKTQLVPHLGINFEKDMFTSNDLDFLKSNENNYKLFYTLKYYFESPSNIFVIYLYKNIHYYLCYNKLTKKTIIFNANEIENDVTYTKMLPGIVALDSTDTFISLFEMNWLVGDLSKTENVNAQLREVVKNSKPTDNPILFLFKYK